MTGKPITIRNCGAAAGETPVVRFKFRCPRTWDSLDAGPDANTRHCGGCQRLVYFCHSPGEAADHAARGDCIAVGSTRAEHKWTALSLGSDTTLGQPSVTIIGEAVTEYGPRLDPRPPGNRSPPADH